MEELKIGSRGPMVELLQSTLYKINFYADEITGVFGEELSSAVKLFQRNNGLDINGVVGDKTWDTLSAYIYGYKIHPIKQGDTLYRIAKNEGVSIERILMANPGLHENNLHIGEIIIVPTGEIVPTNISYSYHIMEMNIQAFEVLFPFLQVSRIGESEMGKEIPCIRIGRGEKEVFYNGSFHANEWITTPVLMKFVENFSLAYTENELIYGYSARDIFEEASIYLVPMVNPDGVDLVTGAMEPESAGYKEAQNIALSYPEIPFTKGWKANINGIDLNLQFPANWETARENKYAQGVTGPAPRDYVGPSPLYAREAKAVYEFTRHHDFSLIIAYHTQGEVIYWKYLDYLPKNSYEIGLEFSRASGYELEETPYASGFAGYKDWFIQDYNRPGYTIEAGLGESPLPIDQFDKIYEDNEGILVLGAVLAFSERN